MTQKKPLMLQVGCLYEAAEFDYFEFQKILSDESKAVLRLHMKNGTIVDLPCSVESLKHLLATLCGAYGDHAKQVLKQSGWL